MNREELERVAKMIISPDNYYDLADSLDSITDDELNKLIACDGNAKLENKLIEELK